MWCFIIDLKHIVFVLYALCQVAMADAINAVTKLTLHISKIEIVLSDLSTVRLSPDIIAPKYLKIYRLQNTYWEMHQP